MFWDNVGDELFWGSCDGFFNEGRFVLLGDFVVEDFMGGVDEDVVDLNMNCMVFLFVDNIFFFVWFNWYNEYKIKYK